MSTADLRDHAARSPRRPVLGSLWASFDEERIEDAPGPRRLDALLVAAGWVGAIVETIFRPDVVWRPVALVAALVAIGALPWRRVHGLAVTVVAFGTMTLGTALSASAEEPFGLYACVLLLLVPYALLRWSSGRHAAIGLGVCVASWVVSVLADPTSVGDAIGGFAFLLLPAAVGALVRARRTVQSEQQRRAQLAERERLARELHDTVAHHMSAVAVQAQAGRTLAATRPQAAVDALAVIEEAASRSLDDLRDMVRSLRSEDASVDAPLTPSAGLAQLDDLTASAPTGVRIEVEVRGPRDAVPDRVGGALHRVAQESVTNAIRHAHRVRRISIDVSIEAPRSSDGEGAPRVVMTVVDDGTGIDPGRRASPGFGIVGMTERAELLGGTLEAGPTATGGWSVRCVLPLGGGR
ncbi:MAG: sensor histidine kinase [Actinomycetota bacterium]